MRDVVMNVSVSLIRLLAVGRGCGMRDSFVDGVVMAVDVTVTQVGMMAVAMVMMAVVVAVVMMMRMMVVVAMVVAMMMVVVVAARVVKILVLFGDLVSVDSDIFSTHRHNFARFHRPIFARVVGSNDERSD